MKAPFDLLGSELPKDTMLLEASAGTGKTFTITGIVLRLLLEGHIKQLSQVLVVTFTNAATQELKARIRKALVKAADACERGTSTDPTYRELGERHGEAGEKILRAALQQCDEMSVATIHSFCKRVLEESAFSASMPFRTEFVEDDVPLLVDAAEDALRLALFERDGVAAAIARHEKLLPQTLIGWHRNYRRHPNTILLPEPEPLAEALAKLRESLHELRDMAASNGLPEAMLRTLPWKKDASQELPASLKDAMVPKLVEMLQNPEFPDFTWICTFATASLRDATHKTKSKGLDFDHPFFQLCTKVERRLDTATHALRASLLESMQTRLTRDKRQSDRVTFDDLLSRIDAALSDPERSEQLRMAIRQRWSIAIIDEFQDTDPVQYRVFAECFRGCGFYVVGDPKQSIYGFRGADVRAYLDARKDAASTHTLGKNHRSHPDLVRAVGCIFDGPAAFAQEGIEMPAVEAAFTKDELAVVGIEGAALQLRCVNSASIATEAKDELRDVIALDIAAEIHRLLNDPAVLLQEPTGMRRLCPSDFAVLTRTNDEAEKVQECLRALGIHSAIGKSGNIYGCREYDEIRTLLTALTHSHRLDAVRAAWTTSLFGRDTAWLLAIEGDVDAMDAELQRFEELRRAWTKNGFLAMFQQLLAGTNARARLLRLPDGERRMTNLIQVGELLHHAEHEKRLRGEGLLHYMERLQRNAEAVASELKELRLESDDDAVKIQTVHGSKGLQYEIVFAPFHWAGRSASKENTPLLARQPDGSFAYDFGSPNWAENRRRSEQDELEENLRLFYVALTRAKRRCIVHLAPGGTARKTAPGWLLLGPGRDATMPSPEDRDAFFDGTKADFTQWHDAATTLAAQSEGCITATAIDAGAVGLPSSTASKHDTTNANRQAQRARALPHEVKRGPWHTSYTQIVQQDRRAQIETDDLAVELRVADESDATPVDDGNTGAPKGFFAFARGAEPGICLHKLFEVVDFTADNATLRDAVATTLRTHGYDQPAKHRGEIDPVADTTAMLATLFDKELPQLGFRLADVGKKQRKAEWRFQMTADHLQPSRVADVFLRHGGADYRDYAASLRTLSPQTIQGYLSGSIDMLIEHEGRYYVIDWKSNYLGARAENYERAALLADAKQNDYALQWSVYLAATHRYLRARLPDYDPSRIGGVCYVYLRGVSQAHPSTGLLTFQPESSFVEAMDAWIGQEARR
jgi:exodeoxyribonuclease V beta subunit